MTQQEKEFIYIKLMEMLLMVESSHNPSLEQKLEDLIEFIKFTKTSNA